MKKIILLVLTILAIQAFDSSDVHAELDTSHFMSKDHGFENNIWKIRIAGVKAIAGMQENEQFGEWCTTETEKEDGLHDVCAYAFQEGFDNETLAIATKETINSIIQDLKKDSSTPINKSHLIVLRKQYKVLDSYSMTWHEVANGIAAGEYGE